MFLCVISEPDLFCLVDLARCQAELTELAQLIQRLHWLEGGLPITNTDLEMRISMQVSVLVATECICFFIVFFQSGGKKD